MAVEWKPGLLDVLFGERWTTAAWRAAVIFVLGYVLPAMMLAATNRMAIFTQWAATLFAFVLTAAAIYKYLQLNAAPEFVLDDAVLEQASPEDQAHMHAVTADEKMPNALSLAALGQAALERLCIALYQFNGLDSQTIATGADGTYRIRLAPRNTGEPVAILQCHGGMQEQGITAYKALLRIMEEDGLGKAFCVAPAGFSADVRAEARSRHVTLVDLKLLQAMLDHLPATTRETILDAAR